MNISFPGLLRDKFKLTLLGFMCVPACLIFAGLSVSMGMSSGTRSIVTSMDQPREILMCNHIPLERREVKPSTKCEAADGYRAGSIVWRPSGSAAMTGFVLEPCNFLPGQLNTFPYPKERSGQAEGGARKGP